MTGRRETIAKERDSKTRHKSCDGNACHIDEAMPREVGNGVSSAWGTYSNFQFYQFSLSLTLYSAFLTVLPSTSLYFI